MSEKVLVAYVKHTGHVIAALTRVTDPSGDVNLDQICAPELRVRLLDSNTVGAPTGLEFLIPKEQLGAIVVDMEDELLKTPRKFKLADPAKPSSTLEKLQDKAPPAPSLPTTGQLADTQFLRVNRLDVEMVFPGTTNPPDKPTPVWALIQRNTDDVQAVKGEFKAKEKTVTIALNSPVSPGQPYKVLILAGTSPVFAKSLTP